MLKPQDHTYSTLYSLRSACTRWQCWYIRLMPTIISAYSIGSSSSGISASFSRGDGLGRVSNLLSGLENAHPPSVPRNSMTRTFSRHSSTTGVLIPPDFSRRRFRSSFSAQTLIIFLGFFDDVYSPLNRCSPTM